MKHFLSDPIHARASDIFCFTETYKHNIDIEELTNNAWTNVFKETDHGFSFCYKKETIKYVRELETLGKVEMMSNLIELSDSKLIVNIVYRQSKIPPRVFLNDLIEEMNALPAEYRKIIVGDLNIDLRDNNLLDLIQEFSQQLNLEQKVNYTTHIKGGILDLVFDVIGSTGTTDWMPAPYSDHFIIYYDL